MALKLEIFVFLCAIATALTSPPPTCKCWDDKTIANFEEFKDFLLKLPEDHDYAKYPVLPGELSPLVCNCKPKQNNRTKRKTGETSAFQQQRHGLLRKPAPRRRLSYIDRVRCAYGHRWISALKICVRM